MWGQDERRDGGRHRDRNAHGSPLFEANRRRFDIHEVSADSAHLSYANMNLVGDAGATPFISFKDNTTAAQGGLFEKMFHFYNLRRDEFLKHYHKGSNIETTNMMIQAKFGDSLRSKTDTVMVNEALAKVFFHNICVLIQSHYELGINSTFWGDEPAAVSADAETAEANQVEMWDWV